MKSRERHFCDGAILSIEGQHLTLPGAISLREQRIRLPIFMHFKFVASSSKSIKCANSS